MILKNSKGREFEIYDIDKDNEIGFDISGQYEEKGELIYLDVIEVIKMIGFLQEQLEIFNNKPLS